MHIFFVCVVIGDCADNRGERKVLLIAPACVCRKDGTDRLGHLGVFFNRACVYIKRVKFIMPLVFLQISSFFFLLESLLKLVSFFFW